VGPLRVAGSGPRGAPAAVVEPGQPGEGRGVVARVVLHLAAVDRLVLRRAGGELDVPGRLTGEDAELHGAVRDGDPVGGQCATGGVGGGDELVAVVDPAEREPEGVRVDAGERAVLDEGSQPV